MKRLAVILAGLLPVGFAAAQESANFKLAEHVFNAAGHPEAGVVLTSASYRIKLDSIGENLVRTGLSSASYRMDIGFGSRYRPPGEVLNLGFLADGTTLVWDAERSVGVYNLYRDLMSALSGGATGDCEQSDLTEETTTDPDPLPAAGDGYFYLVTAENRLAEEGSKGPGSGGDERPNPDPCP